MLLITALCLAGLVPGAVTAWYTRRRGYSRNMAALAGAAVTTALPFLLLCSLIVFPPLGYALAVLSVLAALKAYDRGRIWAATAWAGLAAVATACAGWFR